eukprot:6965212-Prorocentrum_lima.AAC.1
MKGHYGLLRREEVEELMRQPGTRDTLSLVSPQKVSRALDGLPPLPETFFKVVAMKSDPLLDLEDAFRVSCAINVDETPYNHEPLIPHDAYARIMDPREMYGVLIRHGLLEP